MKKEGNYLFLFLAGEEGWVSLHLCLLQLHHKIESKYCQCWFFEKIQSQRILIFGLFQKPQRTDDFHKIPTKTHRSQHWSWTGLCDLLLQGKSNPFPHFCHSSSCLPSSDWHWRNNVPNLPNSAKGGRNPLALCPKILPASTTDNTLPESFVDDRIEFPQPTGHHPCEVQLPFFGRNGTCLPRFLMNIWCLHLRTLQAKMGGTHSSFHNDDFPSLDYDVLQIRDPWNAVSLWQNSQFTFECHFLLLSGLNWLIRKWSRIWSLESPGQRASNISLSQKADSNNLNPQLKTHSHFTIQIHVTTNILFHTASKELVATLLWVKQDCLRYWLLLGSKSISNGAQYVTSDNKIYCKKVKMCRFSSGNWFFLHQDRAASRGW